MVSTLAVVFVHTYYQISFLTSPSRSTNVHTPSLGELINFSTNESGKKLLGESVVHGFTYSIVSSIRSMLYGVECKVKSTLFTLFVLVKLEALEGGTPGYEFVGELGFVVGVLIASTLVVNLVVGVFRFT